jgi:hypothetical protein
MKMKESTAKNKELFRDIGSGDIESVGSVPTPEKRKYHHLLKFEVYNKKMVTYL